jgi:uncharacterized protein (TIGR03067 family)
MKKLFLTCAVFVLPIALSFGADDAKAMQGVWKPVTAVLGGKPMPPPVVTAITLMLTNGMYNVTVEGERSDKGTVKLDTAATPRQMSITGTNGPNLGKTFPAIYELKGDTLRICYDLSGDKFPTEYKSVAGTKLYLVTYKRQH